jgi:uncharacterized protein (UPF0333 family)
MNFIKDNRGQVVIEYTLMLVVVVTLVMTAFNIIKDRFASDPDACANPGTVNPVCVIRTIGFDPDNAAGRPFVQFKLLK